MKRYTVRSIFRDAKGKDLFHRKTFDGMAEDARCALLDAHAEMARLGAEDPRVDSISSNVKGPNEEISSTDYLDELGSGVSHSGLMHEVTPEDLEQAKALNVNLGLSPGDGVLEAVEDSKSRREPTPEMIAAYPDLAERAKELESLRATGGAVPSAGTFRGNNERDPAKIHGSDSEGPCAPVDPKHNWRTDPLDDPHADIHAEKRRIAESYGVPEWLTPGPQRDAWIAARLPTSIIHDEVTYDLGPGDLAVPDVNAPSGWRKLGKVKEFKIKTVGNIFKESKAKGGPTLRDFSGMTAEQREMMVDLYESDKQKYEQHYLGRWPMKWRQTMNRDIMVDIETFGTGQNAAIVSIGAVAFNAKGENGSLWTNSPDALATLGQGFRVNIRLASTPRELRGDIDPDTVEWWLEQSPEARRMLVYRGATERVGLGQALQLFSEWVMKQGSYQRLTLWSNGPTFDETILRSAFTRFGLDFPVHFRGSRCCCTMFDLATSFGWDKHAAKAAAPDDIVKHDALSDAVYQARSVASQMHYLRLTVNVVDQG